VSVKHVLFWVTFEINNEIRGKKKAGRKLGRKLPLRVCRREARLERDVTKRRLSRVPCTPVAQFWKLSNVGGFKLSQSSLYIDA
jgi:hypothetical protein